MWPYPKFIAHRGGGTLAPENTIAAMRCGLQHGFHAVEFDVMLAKDGVPIVLHDPTLGRTVAGKGKVNDFTVQQLSAMDAGSWFDGAHAGEPVPTYEQVFRFCMEHRIWMNVEIKPVPGFDAQTGQVVAEYTKRLLAEHGIAVASDTNPTLMPLFSSFSLDALMAAKGAVPQIPRGILVKTIPQDWQMRAEQIGAVAFDVSYRDLREEQVQAIKQAGYGLFCYTVNEPERAKQLFSWGVDAICTDRIDLIGPGFS